MPPQRSAFDTRHGPVAVTLKAIALDDLAIRDKIVRYLQADALLKVPYSLPPAPHRVLTVLSPCSHSHTEGC